MAVMERNDDLALYFVDECKAHGVLLGSTHKCHEVVLKENSAWVDVPKNIACSAYRSACLKPLNRQYTIILSMTNEQCGRTFV